MIYTSFSEFDYARLKRYSPILADETFRLNKLSYCIQITKLIVPPKWDGQYLFYSNICELQGQCGVAVLSCIPTDKERFGMLLPVAEALCDAYGYNTLLISTNSEDFVKVYEEFGFKKVWSNKNMHTFFTISILCKSMNFQNTELDEEENEDIYEEECEEDECEEYDYEEP
jgi:hypothetical protein